MEFRETTAYKIFLTQLLELKPKIESISELNRKNDDVRLFLHALKGNAGLFGFSELGLLAQQMCSVAERHSEEEFKVTKLALLSSISHILETEQVQ
jgi:hypothetical protein